MKNELTIDSNLADHLVLDESCKESLRTTAQWAPIIAVITSLIPIIISVIVVVFIFTFSASPAAAPFAAGAIFSCLISLGLLYYPLIALLGFHKKIEQALKTNDQVVFRAALKNLKGFFVYVGILVVISVGLTLLELGQKISQLHVLPR